MVDVDGTSPQVDSQKSKYSVCIIIETAWTLTVAMVSGHDDMIMMITGIIIQ